MSSWGQRQRVVGLDVGTKSTGFAVSDERRILVSPKKAIRHAKGPFPWDLLVGRIAELNPSVVVVGYPLEADGSIGIRAQKTEQFRQQLKEKLGDVSDAQCVLQDERYSTWSARRKYSHLRLSKSKSQRNIDSFAAMEILSDYLKLPTAGFGGA